MENYISIIVRRESVTSWRKIIWVNVLSVEPTESLRNLGKWPVVQTNKEKGCSWKSGFTDVQVAARVSAKY